MRFIPVLLIFIVSSLFIASCQKEVDWNTTTPQGNDSSYIKRFVVIDSTLTAGMDTVRTFDFSYNAQKRLASYVHTIYNPGVGGPGRVRAYLTYSYTYPGTDTLPSRIIENINDLLIPANNVTDTFFYFYQNGIIVKDSSGNPGEYYVDEMITLSPTRTLIKHRNLIPPFGLTTDTTYVFTNWQNGNLLQQKDSLWMPTMGFYDITDHNMMYDSKPNPFKRLVLPYNVPFNENLFGTSLEGTFAPTRNNITFYDEDGSTLTTTYRYRADGYPINSWDDDGSKCFYIYTRL